MQAKVNEADRMMKESASQGLIVIYSNYSFTNIFLSVTRPSICTT